MVDGGRLYHHHDHGDLGARVEDLGAEERILQSVIFCDFYYFVFSIMETLAIMLLETTKFKTRGPSI